MSNYHPSLSFPISTSVAVLPPSLAPSLFIISFQGHIRRKTWRKQKRKRSKGTAEITHVLWAPKTVLHRGRRKREEGEENLGNSMRQDNWMEKTTELDLLGEKGIREQTENNSPKQQILEEFIGNLSKLNIRKQCKQTKGVSRQCYSKRTQMISHIKKSQHFCWRKITKTVEKQFQLSAMLTETTGSFCIVLNSQYTRSSALKQLIMGWTSHADSHGMLLCSLAMQKSSTK